MPAKVLLAARASVTAGFANDVEAVNHRFGVEVFLSPSREIIDDVNLMPFVYIGIDDM